MARLSFKSKILRIVIGAIGSLLILVLAFGLYLWRSLPLEKPATMSTLLSAMEMYKLGYKTYPPTLSALGGHPGLPANAEHSELIDDVLASGQKSGYIIRYKPIDTLRSGKFDAFTINADPVSAEAPNHLHYFTDQTGVVRVETGRPATAASPPDN